MGSGLLAAFGHGIENDPGVRASNMYSYAGKETIYDLGQFPDKLIKTNLFKVPFQ